MLNSTNSTEALLNYYANIRSFHTCFEIIVFLIGLSLNCLVAYMSITTKNTTLKQFSIVILIHVFGDVFYTTLTVLIMPVSSFTATDLKE